MTISNYQRVSCDANGRKSLKSVSDENAEVSHVKIRKVLLLPDSIVDYDDFSDEESPSRRKGRVAAISGILFAIIFIVCVIVVLVLLFWDPLRSFCGWLRREGGRGPNGDAGASDVADDAETLDCSKLKLTYTPEKNRRVPNDSTHEALLKVYYFSELCANPRHMSMSSFGVCSWVAINHVSS